MVVYKMDQVSAHPETFYLSGDTVTTNPPSPDDDNLHVSLLAVVQAAQYRAPRVYT